MPRTKTFAANAGSAEINAMVERVAPAILEMLSDGVPRTKAAIVEALAGRHDKQDVVHALIRPAVTDQVEETGGRSVLAAAGGARPWRRRCGRAGHRVRARRPRAGCERDTAGEPTLAHRLMRLCDENVSHLRGAVAAADAICDLLFDQAEQNGVVYST